ncbi:EcsC family protein [Pontibaca methylaminivorans]|uniref:EcsC family protein n=1 Tax=Pontibaca methylaminivorans TaxID=515897 RepID=UPI002FD99B83
MNDITIVEPVDIEAELDLLAARYRGASGIGLQLLNLLGSKAEGLLERLPEPVHAQLDRATEQALRLAMHTADRSRQRLPDQRPWVNTAVTTAFGAAGGFGGFPAALVELPVTTTVLLRAIQGVACEYGFDPGAEDVKFDCMRVFAAAGPLAMDDGADTGFLSLRLALTGGNIQRMIATVAPRLAAVLGQKLAAQSVPVLGALAGATSNYVYTNYYQQVAHVHFGLRQLAINSGVPHDELVARLEMRMRPALR